MSQHEGVGFVNAQSVGSRAGGGAWVHLIAAAVPAWLMLSALSTGYWSDDYLPWTAAAVLFACTVQLFRPSQLLSAGVFCWYVAAIFLVIRDEFGPVQDYLAYGGEDHSRWEGWETELKILGVVVLLVAVACLQARYIWRRRRGAT